MPFPPKTLRIKSDQDELTYLQTKLVNKQKVFYYKYTKSNWKLGLELPMSEEQILKMIKNEIAEEL